MTRIYDAETIICLALRGVRNLRPEIEEYARLHGSERVRRVLKEMEQDRTYLKSEEEE